MEGFKPEELKNFLKAVFALAWADRVIQQEEQDALREMLLSYELSPELSACTEEWFTTPVQISSVDFSCFSEEAKSFVYLSAWLIAKADGKIAPEENTVLRELAARLNLTDPVIERIQSENRIADEMF
ncbi:MAG TPA: DUF533 domain-containing protein [bacterium]|nr:DUF533 domain-containing protein [bacterium]